MRLNAISSNLNFALYSLSQKLSSAKRINSAADDAAGLAISKKLEAQQTVLKQGTDNLRNMDSFLRTADGALGSVTGMVQDINATYVRMNNSIYTDFDRQILQNNISQTSSAIEGVVRQARFNGIPVFSDTPLNVQSSTDSMSVTTGSVATDVSSAQATQDSLKSILSQLGSIGAAENAMQHNINVNERSAIEAASSLSRIADADMAKTISEYTQKSTLQRMTFALMQKQRESEQGVLRFFT